MHIFEFFRDIFSVFGDFGRFLGVKFGFWKSCLCKRNDKYEVCIAVTLFVNMTDDIKWKILLNTKDYQNDIVSRPKRELEPSKFNQSPKDRSKLIWLSAGISCQSQGLCAIVCEAARLLLILVCYISWSCDALPVFWKRCSKTPPE